MWNNLNNIKFWKLQLPKWMTILNYMVKPFIFILKVKTSPPPSIKSKNTLSTNNVNGSYQPSCNGCRIYVDIITGEKLTSI